MLTRPVTTHPEVPMLKGMEKMRLAKVDSLLVTDEDGYFLGIVRAEHVHRCDNKEEAIKSVMREARVDRGARGHGARAAGQDPALPGQRRSRWCRTTSWWG